MSDKKVITTEATQKAVVIGDNMVTINPAVGTYEATAKSEFEARLTSLEQSVASAILSGQLKLVDHALYSCKLLGGSTTIELMAAADQKSVGKRNINNRKLEANTYMCVTGIQLLMANASTEEDLTKANYGKISEVIRNGELEIKQGDKIIFPRNSCEIFFNEGVENKRLLGYHRLENSKVLIPLTDIVPTLWLPDNSAAELNGKAVKIVFHGVRTNG